jgi:NADPH:quinone reductase-like Zn-dependent oxidoreductase
MEMNAVLLRKFGGPDVLTLERREIPVPHDDEILVRIRAASINPVDYKIRSSKYPSVKDGDLPIVLGRDFSGTVESIGAAVHTIDPNEAVFGLLGRERGSYAEYAVAKIGEFTAAPSNFDHIHAAAVPLAALTAWQGLFDHGRLEPGQKVLIHGGAGGVGHFAIQFAKAKGAWVATTCGSDDADFVRDLGADLVIDYKNQRFEDEVHELDLVYDLMGAETQDRSFSVLKRGGTLISTLQEPDHDKAAEKQLLVARYMAEPNAAQLTEICGLIEHGNVRPHVTRTFPLSAIAEAHRFLEHDHPRGKVVLEIA